MKLLACILLVFALATAAAAADVTGKWSGTFVVMGPNGPAGDPNPAFLILKQSGSTLTGTAGQDENEQWPIDNLKMDGNKISGSVSPSDGATYTVTLTVNGDSMTGEVTISDGGQTMKGKIELKRV
ncbi:MAG TPA: hypothetical protein VMB03_06040 [Bryobacteraceae bacterium]|nr:hypothetical protein [Bryobacteraceae bacterium]